MTIVDNRAIPNTDIEIGDIISYLKDKRLLLVVFTNKDDKYLVSLVELDNCKEYNAYRSIDELRASGCYNLIAKSHDIKIEIGGCLG